MRLYDLISIFEVDTQFKILIDGIDFTEKINELHLDEYGIFENNEYSKEILNRYRVCSISLDDYGGYIIIDVTRDVEDK